MEENKGLKEWLETTANEHRCNPTCSEKNVIKYLDKHKIKYEFQKPILCDDRGYIVDFCFEGSLVLEVDGDTHNSEDAKENDYIRTQMLNEKGYDVIRIRNEQTKKGVIEETMKTVVDKIRGNKILEIIRKQESDERIKKTNKAIDSSLNIPAISLGDNDKARDSKGLLLYYSSADQFFKMSDEELGRFIKKELSWYMGDTDEPEFDDPRSDCMHSRIKEQVELRGYNFKNKRKVGDNTKGYTKIPHSIWETDLNLNERYMLLYLLDCENKFNRYNDWFNITDQDLIDTGFGKSKVVLRNTRNSLIDKGYIEFKGGSFKNKSQYKINRVKDEDYGMEG